jgi:hypothetical protein
MSEKRRGPVAQRASIFRRTDEGVPELSEQQNGELSESPAVQTAEQPQRTKRTYYLPNDVILMLGEMQLQRHRETGKKPEVSEIVEEAIRRLAGQQSA